MWAKYYGVPSVSLQKRKINPLDGQVKQLSGQII